jgi:hypothetical protein
VVNIFQNLKSLRHVLWIVGTHFQGSKLTKKLCITIRGDTFNVFKNGCSSEKIVTLFLPNLKNNLIATLTQLSSRENPVFATR